MMLLVGNWENSLRAMLIRRKSWITKTAKSWLGLRFPHDKDKEKDAESGSDDVGTSDQDGSDANAPAADAIQPSESVAEETISSEPAWLGFRLSGDSIRNVEPDSPAEKAGLNNGDELLAIDGYRIQGRLNERLEQYKIGDSLELLISRRQKIMKRIIIAGVEPEEKNWRLQEVSKPSDDQKKQLANWLGIEIEGE